MQGGAAAIPDYELLELVLFRAIPRRDVKPLARALMDRFGDFNRVITAPEPRLRDISGVGDAVIVELKVIDEIRLGIVLGVQSDFGRKKCGRCAWRWLGWCLCV